MATIKNLSKELERALKKTLVEISKPSSMLSIGNELKEDIVKRTRLGFGTDKNNGPRRKLEPLSKSYVEQRKGNLSFWTNSKGKSVPVNTKGKKLSAKQRARNKEYISKNNQSLDSTTRATKSNLTRTGKMLSRLGVLAGVGRAIIGLKTSKETKKAAFVSKKRPFMFATKQQINRLTRSLRKRLDIIIERKIKF